MPFHDGLYRQLLDECRKAAVLSAINEALSSQGLPTHPTLDSLLALLHEEGRAHFPVIDVVFPTALIRIEEDGDPVWKSFLLAAMLPGLEHLHFSLRHTTSFKHGLWEEVLFAFSEAITALAPSQRTSHVQHNLLLEVRKRVRWSLEERAAQRHQEVALEDLAWEPSSEPNHAAALLQLLFEQAVRKGRVSLADCSLVIATELHGLTCAEVARREGLPEDVVRQRKSRALKRLRAFVAEEKERPR